MSTWRKGIQLTWLCMPQREMTDVIWTANIIASRTGFSPLELHMKHKPVSIKADGNSFPLITNTQLWVLPWVYLLTEKAKSPPQHKACIANEMWLQELEEIRTQLYEGKFNPGTSQGRNRAKIFMQPLLKISVMDGTIPTGTHILSVVTRPRNLEAGLSKSNFSGFSRAAHDCNGSPSMTSVLNPSA